MTDERLDLWVETKLLGRSRSKRFSVGAWTRYPNKALLALTAIDLPFTLTRREDLRYVISALGRSEVADGWEDLAYAICRLMFSVVEGAVWPTQSEQSHGEKNS